MSRSISEKLRAFVALRAGYVCEYCLMHENDLVLGAQIDHIISIKHEGPSDPENLAYSCLICNVNKGSDIATILLPDDKLIRFFNPRKDRWSEHFDLVYGTILPKTDIGKATVKILDFNEPERVIRRQLLTEAGRYPGKDPS